MRRRSGTLDIYGRNNPEQYEAEYQCIASNEYGSAYSHKIRLQLYSKSGTGTEMFVSTGKRRCKVISVCSVAVDVGSTFNVISVKS